MYILKDTLKSPFKAVKRKDAVIASGARQVCMTTLIENLRPEFE